MATKKGAKGGGARGSKAAKSAETTETPKKKRHKATLAPEAPSRGKAKAKGKAKPKAEKARADRPALLPSTLLPSKGATKKAVAAAAREQKKEARRAVKAAKKQRKAETTLEKLRRALDAMPDATVSRPSMPVDRLVAEATALAKVAKRHEKELVRVGVNRRLLRELGDRTELLADAQAAYTLAKSSGRSAEERTATAEAEALRSEMLADLRFALRHDASADDTLAAIQEGEGVDDLVQDLRELEALFARHKSAVDAIGAEGRRKVTRAKELRTRLADLVAQRRGAGAESSVEQSLRDRAATALEAAMREVRAAGSYAFRNDAKRQVLYRSAYRSGLRRTGRRAAPAAPSAPVPAEEEE